MAASVPVLIRRYARKYGIDPRAALAVAQGEGGLRWGAVGDNGTSFGPFQLHVGGALPKGKDAKWANSPAGIEYAIRKMAESGARGLKGEAAVNAIVRRFERPADPDTSVARAVGRLGSIKTPASPHRDLAGLGAGRPESQPNMIPPEARGTLNDIFKKVGLKPLDLVGDLPLPTPSVPGQRTASPSSKATAAPAQPFTGPKGKQPKVNLALHLIQKAQEMGLTVTENPYVDDRIGKHTRGSDHYRVIGKRKGRKIGAGGDVSGDPAAMRAFFEYASRFAGKGLKDLFHDPVGYSFDNGKRWDKTIGGHGSHVHWSVG